MVMNVEVDENSGFCYGVVRAIETAERVLSSSEVLYSLGAMVHNETELERLAGIGLRTIDRKQFTEGTFPGQEPPAILIRAHGEPPETYRTAEEKGYRLIDCTCPVVLKLQEKIRKSSAELGPDGMIIIFGKKGHAEVNGLVGQARAENCPVEVVEDRSMTYDLLRSGKISPESEVRIFSQTTKDPEEYKEICKIIRDHIPGAAAYDTICAQVATRHKRLRDFAAGHDCIVFVAGKESSNGKVLYELCHETNPRTHFTGNPSEISKDWFREGESVGVCGATSTPKWLLEKVAEKIRNI